MEDYSEAVPLLTGAKMVGEQNTKYRWVMLTLFATVCFLQMAVWSIWAPISVSATKAIGFTPHDYDLLVNWLPIAGLATIPLFVWVINRKGARVPVVACCILMVVGAGLRCLPLTGVQRRRIIHVGQFFNAMAVTAVLGAPPLLSNTWFPPQERVLATSCMISIGNLGNAASFIIGPNVVDTPNNCTVAPHNGSIHHVLLHSSCVDNNDKIRKQIDHYLYVEFGLIVLVCLLILLFFRKKPRLPPSASAAAQRLDTMAGLKYLSKHYSWWASTISYSLIGGAYFGWYGVVTVVLTPHGLSEEMIDTVGLVVTCTGTIVGILAGWFSDRMRGWIKWIIVGCYTGMFLALLYLVIIVMGWAKVPPFEFTEGGFWTSFIIFGTLQSITLPVGIELLVDIAYPVSEGTSSSIASWLAMLFMSTFLLVLSSVTNQDIANYLFLAIIAIATPIFAISAKDRNARLSLDKDDKENETESEYTDQSQLTDSQINPGSTRQNQQLVA